MKFVIAGGTGFLGTALREALAERNDEVVRLTRRDDPSRDASRWDPARGEVDQSVIESADVVVSVAGSPIVRPWTSRVRNSILSSRLSSTRTLADAIKRCAEPPVFLAQSGTDWYGTGRGDTVLDESTPSQGTSFLTRVVQQVEDASTEAERAGARVCQLRTGAVLDRRSGALKLMLPFFKLGLGGKVSDGSQYFPVISLRDWVRAVLHLGETPQARGPHNLASPEPATNAEFTAALGEALHRPTVAFLPRPLLETGAGDLSGVLLNSLRVTPSKLLAQGFDFRDRTVDEVVASALRP